MLLVWQKREQFLLDDGGVALTAFGGAGRRGDDFGTWLLTVTGKQMMNWELAQVGWHSIGEIDPP